MFKKMSLFVLLLSFWLKQTYAVDEYIEIEIKNKSSYPISCKNLTLQKGRVVGQDFLRDEKGKLLENRIFISYKQTDFPLLRYEDIPEEDVFCIQQIKDRMSVLDYIEKNIHRFKNEKNNFLPISILDKDNEEEKFLLNWFIFKEFKNNLNIYKLYTHFSFSKVGDKSSNISFSLDQSSFKESFLDFEKNKRITTYKVVLSLSDKSLDEDNMMPLLLPSQDIFPYAPSAPPASGEEINE
ncbi:MAG TPA: hypothetical protein VHA52_09935 [Candidatus Babeliaceae bacterium]|nr:hypothetical protein [Candidatus Babeliaceae bacterium]